jgi:geranylgeranyl reductase family protein
MLSYDAVVVGAGPAGAGAAHVLAQGGARVLLVEKARLPRYKPCGGGITARARGAWPLVADFPAETTAGTVRIPRGDHEVICTLPAPIDMVMRDRFDAFLAGKAAAAGAELRDGAALHGMERDGDHVRLRVGKDMLAVRYVVGADGANGVTARLAGFAPMAPPAVAIEVEMAVPESIRDRYADASLLDLACIAHGYGWIFGKGAQLSVGLGVFHRPERLDLRSALERFLASHPDLRAGKILLRRGHRIPLAGGRPTRVRGSVLLAGDAASLADPLTAEGISYAVASGRRAGATVLAALAAGPGVLLSYDRYLARDLCGDLHYARLVAALSYRFPEVVVRLAAENAALLAANTAAVSGTGDYRSLVLQMARKAPALLRALLQERHPGTRVAISP